MNFQDYQSAFETKVVVQGAFKGVIGQIERVSIKPGTLARSAFGNLLGAVIEADQVLVVDYYGHRKFSRGLLDLIEQTRSKAKWGQIRHVECLVIHLAAIRFEDINRLAPELLRDFPEFKKQILDMRGFDHSYRA